jgi:hypothetical protein
MRQDARHYMIAVRDVVESSQVEKGGVHDVPEELDVVE